MYIYVVELYTTYIVPEDHFKIYWVSLEKN